MYASDQGPSETDQRLFTVMKFNRQWPIEGQQRIKTRFLWMPKTINRQTRWLETASWVQRATVMPEIYFWVDECWTKNPVRISI